MLLETRAGGPVCEGPPQGIGGERVGASGTGSPHQHATSVRQDDISVHVCCSDDVGGAQCGNQYIQHVQAHLAETAPQLREVLLRGLQAGPGGVGVQGGPPEHGGDRVARARRRARRARGELVPEQGSACAVSKSQKSAEKSALREERAGSDTPQRVLRAAIMSAWFAHV